MSRLRLIISQGLIFLTIIIISSCQPSSPMANYTEIKAAVEREINLYPEITLIDLYKSFFQGRFGPGHLVNDRTAAMQYLDMELENASAYDSLLWQQIGYEGIYYRLNLKLVKDGTIPKDVYFNAFVESANTAKQPTLAEWKKEWEIILSIIEDTAPYIKNLKSDRAFLADMLESGKVVIHHSDSYRESYHPHYRVIDSKNFEKIKRAYPGIQGD